VQTELGHDEVVISPIVGGSIAAGTSAESSDRRSGGLRIAVLQK
jgi:hypothetical protein